MNPHTCPVLAGHRRGGSPWLASPRTFPSFLVVTFLLWSAASAARRVMESLMSCCSGSRSTHRPHHDDSTSIATHSRLRRHGVRNFSPHAM